MITIRGLMLLGICITSTAFGTPIAITSGSVDFSSLVTSFVFEGKPFLDLSDFTFDRGVNVSDDYSFDRYNEFGDGNKFLKCNSAQAFSSSSEDGGVYYMQSCSPQGSATFANASTYLNFELSGIIVENLKELTIEYDWQSYAYLNTEISGEQTYANTGIYSFLSAYDLPSGQVYREEFAFSASDGVDDFQLINRHVRFHQHFESPFSGIFWIYSTIYTSSGVSCSNGSVPE
jgi:hypothetical protein